jgi:uracil-DNA glycosylase
MTPDRAAAARALLDFYADAGVDALVGEAPADRLASSHSDPAPVDDLASEPQRPPLVRPQLSRAEAPLATPPVAPAPDIAVMAAREAARSAASLDELRAMLEKFEGCALRTTAKQLVFADGNPQARVMFVGEAPGREEDLEGLPFVGRSGKLLDQMIAAIGLDRTSAYIANIIPWRPPGNRTPTPQESQICLPFILRQIELVNPDVLVCMGNPSTQTLLGVKDGIKRTRGRWFNFHTGTREIQAIGIFHPAYLLRSPLDKRLAWRDLLAIKKALSEAT